MKGCHQGQNVTVLANLECLGFKKFFLLVNHGGRQYFSVFHGPSTLKTISPALIYAEHDYVKVNGGKVNEKFVLSVHYNDDNSYLFINGVQQFICKAMSNLNLKNPLVIGNTSANFPIQTDYKKSRYNGDIMI